MTTLTKFWTWAQIYAKINSELDLEEEDFIDEAEMMAYANDAIDEAESLIHSLYEDYFLTRGTITLVNGTDAYDLPTTIYGHKVRGIIYTNGPKIYELKRIRDWKKFLNYRLGRYSATSSQCYTYFLVNSTPGQPQITLTPPSYEAGAYLEIWYLRQANRLTSGTDVCDIPEFVSYVFDYLRERVAYKEMAGSAKHQSALADLAKAREDMTSTLTQMVADGDNTIEPDLSHYEEMA